MRTFRGAWSLAGLAAGLAGLATSYFVAMAMTIRESPVVAVAELVIRVTPGPVAEYLIGLVGQLDKPLLLLGIFVVARLCSSPGPGRLSARRWWAPSGRLRRAWRRSARWPSRGAARVDRDRRVPRRRRLRDLAGHAVAADRAAAAGPPRGGRRDPDGAGARRRPPHDPARVRDPGGAGRSGLGRGRGGRPGGRGRAPARRGDPSAAQAHRRDRASGARQGQDRPAGSLAVADPERRLLPDPHRDRGADDRAQRLVAADPRPGRPGDRR